MLCKHPFVRRSTGIKRVHMVTSEEAREFGTPFPCGQCLPCRINKCRVWTHRLLLEQTQHDASCFITLTYNQEHLPENGELKPDHLTKFFKRLRKRVGKFRYYAVGEYGSKSRQLRNGYITEGYRPHYHIAHFGHGFEIDNEVKKAWSPNGIELGKTDVGELNPHSARYITKYVTEKLTKDFDEELIGKTKEFMRCSKMNGGIGSKAIEQIGYNLLFNENYDKTYVKSLNYGKKTLPLGGYLTKKLAEYADNQEQIDNDFRDWQETLFDDHFNDDNSLYFNIVNDNAQRRHAFENKHKIYSKRKKI